MKTISAEGTAWVKKTAHIVVTVVGELLPELQTKESEVRKAR
jgi:hypothetical protein